jgi:hypothetical protein
MERSLSTGNPREIRGWRKDANGFAANWFPSDDPLALQWWSVNPTCVARPWI